MTSPAPQPARLIHRLLPRLALLSALLIPAPALEALELRVYSPTRHDRFTGFPSSPVANGSFIHAGVDLSGVGWRVGGSQPRSLTLVSPKYLVGARHFRPPVGSTVRFVAADGTVREYTIESHHDILNDDPPSEGGPKPCDVSLAELVETVGSADGVNLQPYLNLSSEAAYLSPPNNQLIVLGKAARGGIGVANSITDFFGTPATSGSNINNTRTIQFTYQNLAGSQDDAFAETGDSGSPILVDVGGQGALVGIHSAVVTALGSTTTVDSFVAHPPYIAQINAIMAADGYHMTEANPAGVTLALTPTVPATIRAGYPVEVTLELANTDNTDDANNVTLRTTVPASATDLSASGTAWVADLSGGTIAARRGGLDPASGTVLSLSFTPSTPGSETLVFDYAADEFAEAGTTVPIEVLGSYLSWSDGLSDPDATADIDFDGITNLLEYAFGGDPEVPSQALASDGTVPLTPVLEETASAGEFTFRYNRRKDFVERGLDYQLQSSTTLETADWSDADGDVTQVQTASLDADFERVTLTLPAAAGKAFYRLAVTLDEAP